MAVRSFFKEHRKIILLLLILSVFSTYITHNFDSVYGSALRRGGNSPVLDQMTDMSGSFAPLVSVSGNPFIVLTALSGTGTLLNAEVIDVDNISIARVLMALPISSIGIFIALLLVTIVKYLLSLPTSTKIFSDAVLGRADSVVGAVCVVGISLLASQTTMVYASEVATVTVGDVGIVSSIITGVISFVFMVASFAMYISVRTMINAIDILAFLLAPIPGSSAVFTIVKNSSVILYILMAFIFPVIATIIGIILVIISFFVFRYAKRLELYYKRVYLIPFFNSIFRRKHVIPLIPKKLPRGVAEEFDDIKLCIECFFMNKTTPLYKRERCYFVRSGEVNYIYKKRLFGKTIKVKVSDETYIEKLFRFLKIFTHEELVEKERNINIVVRREHSKNWDDIIETAQLIDYNAILEERQRIKMEKLKAGFSNAGDKVKGAFGRIFSKKQKEQEA